MPVEAQVGGRGDLVILALEGGGWSAPHPSCLTPRKDLVPVVQNYKIQVVLLGASTLVRV